MRERIFPSEWLIRQSTERLQRAGSVVAVYVTYKELPPETNGRRMLAEIVDELARRRQLEPQR